MEKKQSDSSGGSGLFGLWGGGGGTKETAATAKPSAKSLSEASADDIPKEDLLHLCMKMNKRMQALETKNSDITKKYKDTLEDKRQLLDTIKLYITNSNTLPDNESLDVSMIREKVIIQDLQFKETIKQLEDKISTMEREHGKELSSLEARLRKEFAKLSLSATSGEQTADGQSTINSAFLTQELDRLTTENESLHSAKDLLQSKLASLEHDLGKKKQQEENFQADVSRLEISLREKFERIEEMQKTGDSDKAKFEERVLYLQMQLNTLKSKEETKDRELSTLRAVSEQQQQALSALQNRAKDNEINTGDYKEIIKECHSRINALEIDLAKQKEKEHDLEKNAAFVTVLKAEQDAILASLRKDLKLAISVRDDHIRKCRELEEYRVKAEGKLATLEEISSAMDEAREALEERDARITRMQGEAQVAERNHALRTAMLATAEAHISTLKTDLASKDASAKEAIDRITALQSRLAEANGRMEERVASFNEEIEASQKKFTEESEQHAAQLTLLRDQHAETLESLKREHSKKSNAARILISEKDEELRVLKAKVAELSDEISSGAHNERRIFELAKAQSNRDASYNLHSDTRELAFQQLQHTLASKDLELAKYQQDCNQLSSEIVELRRVTRREGVNMDYLKNIILQYMSLPASAPERNALVPVISTLLQMNANELKQIQSALKIPLWASLPVKEVKPRTPGSSGKLEDKSFHLSDMDVSRRSTVDRTSSVAGVKYNSVTNPAVSAGSSPQISSVYSVESPQLGSSSPVRTRLQMTDRAPVTGTAQQMPSTSALSQKNPLLDRNDTHDSIELLDDSAVLEVHM